MNGVMEGIFTKRAKIVVLLFAVAVVCINGSAYADEEEGATWLFEAREKAFYSAATRTYTVPSGVTLTNVTEGITITADSMVYSEETEIAELAGNVLIVQNGTEAKAETCVINLSLQIAVLTGSVRLDREVESDDPHRLVLECIELTIEMDSDIYEAEGDVWLERTDQDGDVVEVTGDSLVYNGESGLVRVIGNVTIRMADSRATAEELDFDTNTSDLTLLRPVFTIRIRSEGE